MIKKFLITAIIIILSAWLLIALYEVNNHDLSTQKAATCNLKVKGPIYLVSYGDGEVYIANMKVLAESALNNCIDVIYMYRREHLDEEFIQKNKKILEAKRGAGYWLWKPYLILKTLNTIPEGSIVVYLDAGIKIEKPLDGFINNLVNKDVIVAGSRFKNKNYVKRDLLRLMDMDNEVVRDAGHLNAAILAVKNTPYSRSFIKKWLEIGEISGIIDDTRSSEEYKEFVDHRHDQSILSLLYLQNANYIKHIPQEEYIGSVYHHRRRNMNQSLYISRKECEIQMSILGEKLYHTKFRN